MQQKLALILTRGTARQQLSAMTSIVGHKCGFEARLPLYLYKAMRCLAVSRNGEHQPRVNKEHYILLIIRKLKCGHKYDTLIQMIYEERHDS